eukprot:GHVS01026597.1.p1 GENE.GHVS01026597.1~~GHVS01026597.1.p1  ORF type:complete len:885 (-),score=177.75 GHVS01026597.1:356-3010(-)
MSDSCSSTTTSGGMRVGGRKPALWSDRVTGGRLRGRGGAVGPDRTNGAEGNEDVEVLRPSEVLSDEETTDRSSARRGNSADCDTTTTTSGSSCGTTGSSSSGNGADSSSSRCGYTIRIYHEDSGDVSMSLGKGFSSCIGTSAAVVSTTTAGLTDFELSDPTVVGNESSSRRRGEVDEHASEEEGDSGKREAAGHVAEMSNGTSVSTTDSSSSSGGGTSDSSSSGVTSDSKSNVSSKKMVDEGRGVESSVSNGYRDNYDDSNEQYTPNNSGGKDKKLCNNESIGTAGPAAAAASGFSSASSSAEICPAAAVESASDDEVTRVVGGRASSCVSSGGYAAVKRCSTSGCRLTPPHQHKVDGSGGPDICRIRTFGGGGVVDGWKGRNGTSCLRRSGLVGTCETRVKCCNALEGYMEVCETDATQLFDMVRQYFKPDRYSVLKRKMHDLEKIIRQTIMQDPRLASAPVSFRARAHLLLGRTLDVLEVYNAAAEQTLAKAVKLDPLLREGWNALGSVYWKKGSYEESRECFQQSIEQCGPGIESLRGLSMALRAAQSGGSVSKRKELVCLSLSKAKEALSMDIAEPESWYILGNAYMTHFMECDQTKQHLQKALAAYNHAEELFQKRNQPFPDLYRNRALTYRYVEEYGKALSDLDKGATLDSESGCREEARQLRQMLIKISGCIQRKYRLKPRELAGVLERLNEEVRTFTNANVHQAATGGLLFKYLVAGPNPSRLLVVKLLAIHSGCKERPVRLGCVSADGVFVCVSLYNTSEESLLLKPIEDVLIVCAPLVAHVSLNDDTTKVCQQQEATFWSVRASGPNAISLLKGASVVPLLLLSSRHHNNNQSMDSSLCNRNIRSPSSCMSLPSSAAVVSSRQQKTPPPPDGCI